MVLIQNATDSAFNTSFLVLTTPTTTTFTFAITHADGHDDSATSTVCIAPLGWTREFSGTNKAVYRAPSGNRYYLRVDDSQAQYATINVYETMSDVDTGTNATTTVYWKKSDASSTATREWYLIGDATRFYLTTAWNGTSYSTLHGGYSFGDFTSYKSGDIYNTFVNGHTTNNPSYAYANSGFYYVDRSTTTGNYLVRSFSGQPGSVVFCKYAFGGNQMGYSTTFPLFNPVDNGIHLFPTKIVETGYYLRGTMPGLWCPLESSNGYFSSNDRTIVIGGRTYMAIKIQPSSGAGNCWFDITGPWS